MPNYIVAKYFIENNANLKNIWLVHSEKLGKQNGTYELALNIKEVLQEEFSESKTIRLVPLEDISVSAKIIDNINNNLIKQLESSKNSVHLNYTGGTKAMAVHVHRALVKYPKSCCTFSYLDARDFRLKTDEDGVITGDLRKSLGITMESLMKLHGYNKKEEQDNPNWPEVVNDFSDLISRNKLSTYLKWATSCLQGIYFNSKGFIENKNKFLLHNNLSGNNDEQIQNIRATFAQESSEEVISILSKISAEHSLLDENGQIWLPDNSVSNNTFQNRLKASVKNFLHGKWLEVYVYNVIEENIAADPVLSLKIIPRVSNWKINKIGINKPDFELDVVLLNGYQVCGISCTTSEIMPICKEKGFEVLHRVNQIGGEEAKAVLVTCLDDEKVATLQDDLATITGSSDNKLLIIGMSELKDTTLWREIKRHIWG